MLFSEESESGAVCLIFSYGLGLDLLLRLGLPFPSHQDDFIQPRSWLAYFTLYTAGIPLQIINGRSAFASAICVVLFASCGEVSPVEMKSRAETSRAEDTRRGIKYG